MVTFLNANTVVVAELYYEKDRSGEVVCSRTEHGDLFHGRDSHVQSTALAEYFSTNQTRYVPAVAP